MTQVEKFLEVANAEVGYVEGPKNNQTKYGAFSGHNYQPWCGSFVMWCANKVGLKIPNCVYTPAGVAGFQGKGQWYNAATSKPKPGDIAFFDFPGGEKVDDVGIVHQLAHAANDLIGGLLDAVLDGHTTPYRLSLRLLYRLSLAHSVTSA